MRRKSEVIRTIDELFPNHQIRLKKKFKTVNSEIYITELIKTEDGQVQNVVCKFYSPTKHTETLNEFKNLTVFNNECENIEISSPAPLAVDVMNELIVMEYVNGISLKQLLLQLRPIRRAYLIKIIKLSAVALSKFHHIFEVAEDENLLVNSPLLADDIDISTLNTKLSQCNLQIKSKSFIDFTPWNIIISDKSKPKIYLIDFPNRKCIYTPHLDLARFKFSLRILKQYPQFRFLKINWWNVNSIYDEFLQRYCEEIKAELNRHDMAVINFFISCYAKKLDEIYHNSSKIRFRLEHIYLKHCIKSFINPLRVRNKKDRK